MAASIDNFNDLKELGIDCEDDSLTEKFNKAADHLQHLVANLDKDTLLTLYGYYKQGSQGPCNTPKPGWYDMKAKSKWEAWNKLGTMPQKEAKTLYIETVKKLDPSLDLSSKESWVRVSSLADMETNKGHSPFDLVKKGEYEELAKYLESDKSLLDQLDQGLGLIHWAADRGSLETVQILIKAGVNLNLKDVDGQTALHYASCCGHLDVIKSLLENNANRDIMDNDGVTAEEVAAEESVRELFKTL